MHPAQLKRFVAEQIEANRRGARPVECERCGAPCIRGEDDDNCSVVVTVDVDPVIGLVDEMLTIMRGRQTFDLAKAHGKSAKPGQHNLYVRHDWHVDSTRTWGTVHAEHQCKENPA